MHRPLGWSTGLQIYIYLFFFFKREKKKKCCQWHRLKTPRQKKAVEKTLTVALGEYIRYQKMVLEVAVATAIAAAAGLPDPNIRHTRRPSARTESSKKLRVYYVDYTISTWIVYILYPRDGKEKTEKNM